MSRCWRSSGVPVPARGNVADVRHVAAVLILLGVTSASARAQASADSVGRVTFRVMPETVTVGQPFVVSMRAIPPKGRQAIPPAVPDTGGLVEPLDLPIVSRRGDTLAVRYRLLAWQPGVLSVAFGPVLMRRDSSEITVPVDVRVVVSSVLPADSSDRIPKDPRALFPFVTHWWDHWWQWLLALTIGLGAIYVLYRWRTRVVAPKPIAESPLSRAEAAFARLDSRQLPTAGEGGRHVALAAEIMRQYLSEIEPSLGLAFTNAELLRAVEPVAGIPDTQLGQFLRDADTVRFSGGAVDVATARRVAGVARDLVRDVDRVRAAILPVAA